GVLMRLGIAKVDEQAIAQVLCYVAIERLERRHSGLLVGAHHDAVVFRIKPLGESRRVDQIAEHHRELAAFGLRRGRSGCEGGAVDRVVWLGLRQRSNWGRAHGWWLGRRGLTNPYQHPPAFISSQPFGLDEFVLEGLKLVIVQAELYFEGTIRHTPLAL